ncbi:MAG: hypothetical protein M9910_08775 [Kiritimatiellae bacterium]|nr:hypothetical protein [Kiritimatiellia bacterium]
MNSNQQTPERLEGNAGKEFAKQHLVQLKTDAVNGKILWRNPTTGDFWKEYFPWPEAHGDGPSVFVKISADEAEREFQDVS